MTTVQLPIGPLAPGPSTPCRLSVAEHLETKSLSLSMFEPFCVLGSRCFLLLLTPYYWHWVLELTAYPPFPALTNKGAGLVGPPR